MNALWGRAEWRVGDERSMGSLRAEWRVGDERSMGQGRVAGR